MSFMPAERINDARPDGHTLPRGWQAYALFCLLPLWWLLGFSMFMWPVLVAPLLGAMVLGRWKVLAPRRFGLFLLLIAWMIASGFEVQGGQRLLAWGWRLSFFICGAILLLFIYNIPRRRLPTRSITNSLAAYWVIVVMGGWFGVIAPNFQLKSFAESVLPKSVVNNQYVYSHVHLQFAEVQHFLGFPIGRPETFFAYTNAWGSAFAILTPFAIAAVTTTTNRAWRNILVISMFAAVVPVVFSLNRGLWLSLGVGIMYAAVRLSANRDFRLVRGIVGATVCIVVLLVATPLGGLATSRFSHQTGDTGRLQRDQAATQQVLNHPVLGYGAPTQNTVAGQSAIGTESEVFLLVYSHGIPALAMFFIWFAYTLVRSARYRNPDAFWAHVVILIAMIQSPYYELTERMPLIMVAAAICYRAMADDDLPKLRPKLPSRRRVQEPQPLSV